MIDERVTGWDESADGSAAPHVALYARQLPAAPLRSRPLLRRGRKPSPEKRTQILEAAIHLFTTNDYHRVLMDDVARAAGVGKGTVYRYFPTKEALFLELVTLAVDRASEVIRAGIEDTAPAVDRLRRAVAMTFEYFRRNEQFHAILYHEKVFRCCREREELEDKRAELRGFYVRLLTDGIAEGSLRQDLEPLAGAIVLMSSMRGFLRVYGSRRSSQELADQLLATFLDGALKRPESSQRPSVAALDAQTMDLLDPLAALAQPGMAAEEKPLSRDGEKEQQYGLGGAQQS